MARNSGFFNRLLNVIGLVDDDAGEENTSRRVQPEDARARYGNTSSATSYSRDRQGAGSYGSTGKAARYSGGAYQDGPRSASAQERPQQRRGTGSYPSFERPSYDERAARDTGRQQIPVQDELDELDFDYQPPQKVSRPQPAAQRPARREAVEAASPRRSGDSRHHLIVYYLHTLDECRDVISDLLENKSVLLNLEDMDDRLIQRAIDTLGGAAFALNATLRRASDRTYLIAPTSVDIAYTNDADRR